MKYFMVFDVESVGLHGEGFAVGFVVMDSTHKKCAEGIFACDSSKAKGKDAGRKWIAENLPKITSNCSCPQEVRTNFWQQWMNWKNLGAVLVADVAWPVEAKFLSDCINDDYSREWDGPYPLYDISSMLGYNDLPQKRMKEELPVHNPLADAKQSARFLSELKCAI